MSGHTEYVARVGPLAVVAKPRLRGWSKLEVSISEAIAEMQMWAWGIKTRFWGKYSPSRYLYRTRGIFVLGSFFFTCSPSCFGAFQLAREGAVDRAGRSFLKRWVVRKSPNSVGNPPVPLELHFWIECLEPFSCFMVSSYATFSP